MNNGHRIENIGTAHRRNEKTCQKPIRTSIRCLPHLTRGTLVTTNFAINASNRKNLRLPATQTRQLRVSFDIDFTVGQETTTGRPVKCPSQICRTMCHNWMFRDAAEQEQFHKLLTSQVKGCHCLWRRQRPEDTHVLQVLPRPVFSLLASLLALLVSRPTLPSMCTNSQMAVPTLHASWLRVAVIALSISVTKNGAHSEAQQQPEQDRDRSNSTRVVPDSTHLSTSINFA